jgi:hypothetical protein
MSIPELNVVVQLYQLDSHLVNERLSNCKPNAKKQGRTLLLAM